MLIRFFMVGGYQNLFLFKTTKITILRFQVKKLLHLKADS